MTRTRMPLLLLTMRDRADSYWRSGEPTQRSADETEKGRSEEEEGLRGAKRGESRGGRDPTP